VTRRQLPDRAFLERLLPSQTAIRGTIDEVCDVFVRPNRTLFRAMGQSAFWVLTTIVIAAAVNYLVNTKSWTGLLTLAGAALAAGIAYFYLRVRRRAAVWLGMAYYADRYLDGHETLEKDKEHFRRLAEKADEKHQRLRDAFEHADEAVKAFGRMLAPDAHQTFDPTAARACLLLVMKFFSSLAQRPKGPPPRCGLLVRDTAKPDELSLIHI